MSKDNFDFSKPPHLSYSTITSFISNRFSWLQGKICGRPFEGNVHTERGHALEHGVDLLVDGKSLADAKDAACQQYESKAAGMTDYDVNTLQSLRDVLDKIFVEFPYADVSEKQFRVEMDLGFGVPVIGYLDYLMTDRTIYDLKSTKRKPSGLSQNYKVQGGTYDFWNEYQAPVIYAFGIHTKTANYVEIELDKEAGKKMLEYAIIAGKAILRIYDLMSKPIFMFDEKDRESLFKMLLLPDLDACWNPKDYGEAARWIGLQTSKFPTQPK